MKKTHICIAAAAILSFANISCRYGLEEAFYRQSRADERAASIKEVTLPSDLAQSLGDEYTVLVITDVHFGANSGIKGNNRRDEDFLSSVKNLSPTPKFCICLGDIAEHGYESEFRDYKEKIQDKLDKLGIPTFNVVGNHDLFNTGWKYYKEVLGETTSFYRFSTKNISWYFLDSAGGSLGTTQMQSLYEAVSGDTKPKFFFTHVPLYANGHFYFSMQNTDERNKLIVLLNRNKAKTFVTGHIHTQKSSDLGSFTEYTVNAFLADKKYGLLTVNETEGTAVPQFISY